MIEHLVKDNGFKITLKRVLNQWMEKRGTEYIQASDYGRSKGRQNQKNYDYEGNFTISVDTLDLKVG